MSISPYSGKPISKWEDITKKLVQEFPLSLNEILNISLVSWSKIWDTKVGNKIELKEVDLPATVIGYFFQKMFTYELINRYPKEWRGEREKSDKDIVYLPDSKFSVEMKSSGQLSYFVYGNRSYCQKSDTASKAKSGYYITVNFYRQTLTLIRLGWIDQDDWNCQDAESGQAATLPHEVYKHKFISINGKYQLESPVGLLYNVGKRTIEILKEKNIKTFKDILLNQGKDKVVDKIIEDNVELLSEIRKFLD
jgi:hypothetical protein